MVAASHTTAQVTWETSEAGLLTGHLGAEAIAVHERDGLWSIYPPDSLGANFRTEAEVRSFVERVAARTPEGGLLAALGRAANRRDQREWGTQALGMVLAGGSVAAPGHRVGGGPDRQVLVNVRALARRLRRQGYVIQSDGSVREVWRERAQGRWIVPPFFSGRSSDGRVRVEAGRLLYVHTGDSFDGAYSVSVDGRHVADTLGRRAAQAYAVAYVASQRASGGRS